MFYQQKRSTNSNHHQVYSNISTKFNVIQQEEAKVIQREDFNYTATDQETIYTYCAGQENLVPQCLDKQKFLCIVFTKKSCK